VALSECISTRHLPHQSAYISALVTQLSTRKSPFNKQSKVSASVTPDNIAQQLCAHTLTLDVKFVRAKVSQLSLPRPDYSFIHGSHAFSIAKIHGGHSEISRDASMRRVMQSMATPPSSSASAAPATRSGLRRTVSQVLCQPRLSQCPSQDARDSIVRPEPQFHHRMRMLRDGKASVWS
jgi:hypothetical protein